MEEEAFDASVVPDEVWFHVLAFLDAKSLMKAQLTCKTFYDLGRSDSVWKSINTYYFGDLSVATLENRVDVINEPKGYWKRMFKQIAGNQYNENSQLVEFALYDEYVAFISRYYDDFSSSSPAAESKLSAPSTLEFNFPSEHISVWNNQQLCKIYVGEGWAPWGAFASFAISQGLYVAFSHLYSEGWFTVALEKRNIEDGIMQGGWKSNWQSICGVGIVVPNPDVIAYEDYYKQKIASEFDTIEQREKGAEQIQGKWAVTIVLENGKQHKMSLSCYDDHGGSVKGQITQDVQSAFDEGSDCAVLGITDGGMVAFLLNFALRTRRSSSRDFILLLGRLKQNSKHIEQTHNNNNNATEASAPKGLVIDGIGAVYSTQSSLSFTMQKEAEVKLRHGKTAVKRAMSTSY